MFASLLMAAVLSIDPVATGPVPTGPVPTGAVSLDRGQPSSAPSAASRTQPTSGQPAAATTPRLPVSLSRIRRELAKETTQTERFENFRLISSLQVYGQAPRFEVFTADDRYGNIGPNRFGAVASRYGSPTHAEFLSQVTPDNFEAPVMNLSGGLFSLSNWIAEKKREAQRRKETEERQKR